jgi:hypothetical protein
MALESASVTAPANVLPYLPYSQGTLMQAPLLVDSNWLLRSSVLSEAVQQQQQQQQQQQRQQQLLSSYMINGLAFTPFGNNATGTNAVDDSTLRLAMNTGLWQQQTQQLGGMNNVQYPGAMLSSLAPSFSQLSATGNFAAVGGLPQMSGGAVATPTSVLVGQERQQVATAPNEMTPSSLNRLLGNSPTTPMMRATNEGLDAAQSAVARLPPACRSTSSSSESPETTAFVGRPKAKSGGGDGKFENKSDSGISSTSTTSSSITDQPTQSSRKENKRRRR